MRLSAVDGGDVLAARPVAEPGVGIVGRDRARSARRNRRQLRAMRGERLAARGAERVLEQREVT